MAGADARPWWSVRPWRAEQASRLICSCVPSSTEPTPSLRASDAWRALAWRLFGRGAAAAEGKRPSIFFQTGSSDAHAAEPRVVHTMYFDIPIWHLVGARFPWLLSLMLVQSASGWVIEAFEGLIAEHVVLAAFLTMLVGGGGNSSGQTIAELVRRLGAGEIVPSDFTRVVAREVLVGAILAVALGICTFPRVRLLSMKANSIDAIAISLSYMLIVVLANAIAVVTVMVLDRYGCAAVGSPPVVQVLVDVLGITVACFVAMLIYSIMGLS